MSIFDFNKMTTHVGFADEAYWNRGNFRSVACVSAHIESYQEIERRLCMARCQAGAKVSEIKWSELNDYERQRDADSVPKAIVELAENRKLRIDVLIWNNLYRQSTALQHDATEGANERNLKNMYHSLIKFVLERWEQVEGKQPRHWTIAAHHPDSLNRVQMEQFIRKFDIPRLSGTSVDIKRAKTALNYSVQLADLLAGLGAYSHTYWQDYELWMRLGKPRNYRGPAENARNRFPVMDAFLEQCDNKQNVSLLQQKQGWLGRGLWTTDHRNPENTINFWPYTANP